VSAARHLFVKQGYHETRSRDIASEADLAVGTFYLYFADKRDAFLAFIEEATSDVEERIGRAVQPDQSLEQQLRASLGAVLDYADENPGVLAAAMADEAVAAGELGLSPGPRDHFALWLVRTLDEAADRGEISSDLDIPTLAHAIVGMVQQAARYARRSGRSRDLLVSDLSQFCVRALEPGRGGMKPPT